MGDIITKEPLGEKKIQVGTIRKGGKGEMSCKYGNWRYMVCLSSNAV